MERWVEKGLFVSEGFDGKMDWEIGMGVVDGRGLGLGDVDGRGLRGRSCDHGLIDVVIV